MKPGRRRNREWEHVIEESGGRFTCKHCKESYKGSGSRIKSHLLGEKGGGIRPCPNSPLIPENKAPSHDSCSISNSMEMIPSSSGHNTTRSPSFVDSNLKRDVDNLIVEFLSLNNLPLETVEQPCFRNLLGAVATAGTTYELPTSGFSVFTDSLPFAEKVTQYIHNVCSLIEKYGCTIVIHPDEYLWGSNRMSIYTPEGVICTYPNEKKFPAESISQQLVSEINSSLDRSPFPISLFDDYQIRDYEDFGGIDCCATKRIIKLLNKMQLLFLDKGVFSLERNVFVKKGHEKDGRQICNYPLSSVLQGILQSADKYDHPLLYEGEILDALGPLIGMLFVFDNYVPNIGYFYGAILKAESRLKHYYDRNIVFGKELWELFIQYKEAVLDERHYVAAYLNPGFMFYQRSFLPNDIHDYLLTKYMYMDDNTKSKEEVDAYEKKDESIFTEEARSMLHTYHPVKWWKEFGSSLPKLQILAFRILSRRVNSLSHPHHRLKFDCRSDDIFRVNAIMMEEFGKWKQENDIFTPIDLNILDAPIIIQDKKS